MRAFLQLLNFTLVLLCVLSLVSDQSLAGDDAAQLTGRINVSNQADESRQQNCPPGTIFGQTPFGTTTWNAITSDVSVGDGYLVYDNFDDADGALGIRFWGITGYYDGAEWASCVEDPMVFDLTFWDDDAGQPGAYIDGWIPIITPIPTGIIYTSGGVNYELYEYEFIFPATPALSGPGWISIQGFNGDPNCWFLWMGSEGLDDLCYLWNGSDLVQREYDMSFCLFEEPCEWNPGNPYKMHYPQLPDTLGWDVNAIQLADDWLCTESGFIKDIHFWASWLNDSVPRVLYIYVYIYSDIPADQSPNGYSIPGEVLWEGLFFESEFDAIPLQSESWEGWYSPLVGETFPDNHQQYIQYNICTEDTLWFYQEEGTIYWLSVDVAPLDPGRWGWKTSHKHWNDNAVYWDGVGEWHELYDPLTEESLDLSFVITNGETGDCEVNIGEVDGGGFIDIDDVVYLIQYIFAGGYTPIPYTTTSGDVDCSCIVDIDDVVYLIQYIFQSGDLPCSCEEWVAICGAIR